MSSTANTTRAVTGNQFGTFAGVFTPSILTILGVIMFMRAGYVVGQAGVSGALLILLAAEVIAVLTALSMSAIATNTPVRGGGAYFLISRVLGPQYGGAIGLALYIAQALSVPFYILGFTASVTQSFPSLAEHYRSIALATAGLLFVINYISSSLAIKTQYVVMTLLSLSILTFLGGAVLRFDPELLAANWSAEYSSPDLSFWVVFAVYFPAVTGFLAGVNMSGDLKDPSKSLVKGSFWAVGLGFVIYAIQIVLSGASQARPDLIARPYEMLMQNALFGASFLVIGGVFSATISSAVGSFLGAPRVLQAVARDQILPRLNVFAKGSKEKDEPRVALWLTLVLSLIVIFFAANPERDSTAAFDAIASLVTMIFLCTYGMINLAAFVESYGRNPSFRPRFRFFHWSLSLLGFLACFAVMLLIDPVAAGGAILVLSGLYAYISRRLYTSAFGDARRGFLFNIAIRSLQRLRGAKADPKNWRPTILVMAGSSTAHLTQIRYGDWLEGGCGLVTAARVIVADQVAQADRRRAALRDLEEYIEEHALSVFPEIVLAKELDEGMRVLVQAHSIGPLKSNTVVFGWPRTVERAVPFFRHLQDCSRL
ncbi:MAG: amino acid permease, partial [Myxococcota bacterium]|nr:amino acid permease [Myxococcota bacterium]